MDLSQCFSKHRTKFPNQLLPQSTCYSCLIEKLLMSRIIYPCLQSYLNIHAHVSSDVKSKFQSMKG